jgi:hypothetical protein
LSSPAALLQKKRPCTRFPSVPRTQKMQALTDCRAALHSRPYSDMHDFKSLQTDERGGRSVLPWVVGEVLLRMFNAPGGLSRFSTREVWFSSDLNLVPIIILGQQDRGPGVVSVDRRGPAWEKERVLRQRLSRLDIQQTTGLPGTLPLTLHIGPSCRPVPDPIPHRYFSAESSSTLMPRSRAVAAKVCGLPNLNAQLKTRELAGANDE